VNPLHRNDAELSDAEIEAIVRDAIAAEASTARREAAPPSSAIVWWRAQMRARREAARTAERPLTIVHAVAIACGLGLLLGIGGIALAGIKAYAGTLSLATIDLTNRWIALPATAMVISVLVASIAAYLIFADE
jgi:hypothetical protein